MQQGPFQGESSVPTNESPSFLALGDSWFWFGGNCIYTMQKILNSRGGAPQPILVIGGLGAEAKDYVGQTITAQLARLLDYDTGYGRTIRGVFVSGGGNDIAGFNDLRPLLRDGCAGAATPADCFLPGQPLKRIDQVVRYLATVHALVQEVLPNTPVLLNSYDYAIPNGRDTLGFGNWLRAPMLDAQVPLALHQGVVDLLINTFADCMVSHISPTFLPVETLNTLKTPSDWSDELHPTRTGFAKIGRRWKDPFTQLGFV